MNERIRFHLDEHVDPEVARALRRRGIDVVTAIEAGLRTKSDQTHWDFACRERRVIVTHDEGFLAMASDNPDHPGIAYCHQRKRSLGQIIESLIYEVLTPDEMAGHIEYL